MKIAFSPPDINDNDIQAVVDVLKSGWITTGPKTKEFETELSAYCGTARTACMNSATAALELTLRVLGIGSGDEVITSAYTYSASASVICHVGAKPVLVDTAADSFEMDPQCLSAAINGKTKAIIPVDIAGIPCDYDTIHQIVDEKCPIFTPSTPLQSAVGRVAVIADAAHSLGAVYKGRASGGITDFTCFSFHAVKNLTTGEGGSVTWRDFSKADPAISDDDLYRQFMLYSLHGQDKDALAKSRLGAWEYDIVGPFYKCNMTNIAAALGSSQLKRYDKMLARRLEIVETYNNALASLPISLPVHVDETRKSSGHLYMIRLDGHGEAERNAFIAKMAEHGVACNVHYKPLPMLSAYKNIGFDIADFQNAYNQYSNVVSLPLHTCLTDNQVKYVTDTVKLCV